MVNITEYNQLLNRSCEAGKGLNLITENFGKSIAVIPRIITSLPVGGEVFLCNFQTDRPSQNSMEVA